MTTYAGYVGARSRLAPGRPRAAAMVWAACALMLPWVCACRPAPEQDVAATQPAPQPVTRTAADGPVSLTVHVDRTQAQAGQPIELQVAVEAERGVSVQMPDPGEVFGDFEITHIEQPPPVENDLHRTQTQVYTLQTVLPGEVVIPPIGAAYVDAREKAGGSREQVTGAVTTQPIRITIEAGLADVKDPVSLPLPWPYRLLLWLGGVVAALVLIALLARRIQRRRGREPADPLPIAQRRHAHEWALAELAKLAAEDLVGRGQVQEYYYRINGIVRRYIELRFGLMAGEQTSEEFIRTVQSADVLMEGHKDILRRFTAACDPVKYARQRPEPAEIDWVAASARAFVLETADTVSGKGEVTMTSEATA